MRSGKDIRNRQNINGLMKLGEVGVFGLGSNDNDNCQTPPSGLAFWTSSNFHLMKQELTARAWFMNPAGHPSDMYYSDATASELKKLADDFSPHIVIIEGLWLHRYIDALRKRDCRIVLDNYNVEAAVVSEIASTVSENDLPARLLRGILPERTKMIERKAADTVDQVWVCSNNNARLMRKLHGTMTPIHVVPNAVDIDYYREVRAKKSSDKFNPHRRDIIFPASFRWEPNAMAVDFLIDEVFPRLVETFPDCRLLLVGNMPTPQMMAAARRDSRIVVTGQVPDVRSYLIDVSVMVVPLFQGGGTRFKILEAFASNLPVVSTAKGAEGLDVKNGTHLLIAESGEEFVSAVQRAWTDESMAKHLTANGLRLVKRLYSREAAGMRIS